MTDDAKQIVCDLRYYAKRYANPYCCWVKISGTERLMEQAADMIEKLSADLETDERQHSREIIETRYKAISKLKADRDAYKRLAKAAERELEIIRPCYCCEHYCKELAESGEERDPVCGEDCVIASKWKWRGPCAENGGGENANGV